MRRRVPSLAHLAGTIRSPKVRAYIRRVSMLCPAALAYLGRHAHGTLWHLVGQSRPEWNGLYVSAPYVTGDGPRTWPGVPALSWCPWDLFGDVP